MMKTKSKKFLPDLTNRDPEDVMLPSVEELAFLGKANLREILCRYRNEEQAVKRAIKRTKREKRNISQHFQDFKKDVSCDWSGMKTLHEPKAFECRFGEGVAEWCKMTPSTGECGLKCLTEPCMFITVCRNSVRPYSHQTCLFATGNTSPLIPECEAYLDQRVEKLARRRSKISRYLGRIQKAEKETVEKPLFASWRKQETWGQRGQMVMALFYGAYGIDKIRLEPKPGVLDRRYYVGPGSPMNYAWIVDFGDTIGKFHPASASLIPEDEFIYLWENREYLDLWASIGAEDWMGPETAKNIAERIKDMLIDAFESFPKDLIEAMKEKSTSV